MQFKSVLGRLSVSATVVTTACLIVSQPAPASTNLRIGMREATSGSAGLKQKLDGLNNQVGSIVDDGQKILDDFAAMKAAIQSAEQTAPPVGTNPNPGNPQPTAPPPPLAPSSMSIDGLPVEGSSAAKVAIIELTDFECPFCGRYAAQTYPKILSDYISSGKIKYYYRDYPLMEHPHAQDAAQAAHCAQDQGKFWEMHDSLFAGQKTLEDADLESRAKTLGLNTDTFNQCLTGHKYGDQVRAYAQQAGTWGITGTPTFFIGTLTSDGTTLNIHQTVNGAYPYDTFKTDLDNEIAGKFN